MPVDSGLVVISAGFTLCALSTVIVALRFYCRYHRKAAINAFDYVMLAALLATWGNTVLNYYQVHFGKGSTIARFSHSTSKQSFEAFERSLRGTLLTWYLYRITYPIALCLVKLSILLFYRTLASPNLTFRRGVHLTIVFVLLYTLATAIASIFQCDNPADAVSTISALSQDVFHNHRSQNKAFKPKCYDPQILWAFSAGTNLLTDILILFLPIPTLLSLRVPVQKRFALIGLFSIGIVAIAASCVRLWIMALWARSVRSQGKFGTDLLLWGQVEVNAGIVCASMPFLGALFQWKRAGGSDDKTALQLVRPASVGGEGLASDTGTGRDVERNGWI